MLGLDILRYSAKHDEFLLSTGRSPWCWHFSQEPLRQHM